MNLTINIEDILNKFISANWPLIKYCDNQNCQNLSEDGFSCNLRHIIIDENGKCAMSKNTED